MTNWKETTVGEITAKQRNALVGGPFGSNLVSRDYVDSGVPVIRGQNMGHGRWVAGDFAYVSEAKAKSLNANIACPGDLLFTQRGTLGQVAIVPESSYDRYVISQSQMKLTADSNKADVMFLYYVFTSPYQQDYILQNTIQTGVPHTNLGILRDTPITLPSVKEQKRIAGILGSLDDKIELNRRMNETLEAMARAIFQGWFVDFDPVIDNALAAGHPIPDELKDKAALRKKQKTKHPLPKAIQNLFPDRFESSPLGPIPKGWKVSTLSDKINIIGGGTPKTSAHTYWDGDIPWFSVADAPSDSDVFVIDTEKKITQEGLENSSTRLLPEGATIISARGTVGKCAMVGKPMAFNQSCYGLLPEDEKSFYYTYFLVRLSVGDLQRSGHGSVFNTITRNTFEGINIVAPCAKTLVAYESKVSAYIGKIKNNLNETKTLTQLRDTLLPKLLTGEIEV